jgi:hypothetical protein
MLIAAVLSLGVPLVQDDWTVKAPLSSGQKQVWAVTSDSTVAGGAHKATFDLSEEVSGSADAKGLLPVKLGLDNLTVDESTMASADAVGKVSAQNVLISGDSDESRSMFLALLFVYPTDPMPAGYEWKGDYPTTKSSYDFKATGVEKVKDEDTMKVTGTIKDATTDGLNETGSWWVNHAGRVVKFKIEAHNWSVTMGNGMVVETITMDGALKP